MSSKVLGFEDVGTGVVTGWRAQRDFWEVIEPLCKSVMRGLGDFGPDLCLGGVPRIDGKSSNLRILGPGFFRQKKTWTDSADS